MDDILTGSALDRAPLSKEGKFTEAKAEFGRLKGLTYRRSRLAVDPSSLDQIAAAYEEDSLVRQAVDQYVDLIVKDGVKLRCKDLQVQEQLSNILRLGCLIRGLTMDEWWREQADSLVKYAVVPYIDYRLRASVDEAPEGTSPLIGWEIIPAERMRFELNSQNRITWVYLADHPGESNYASRPSSGRTQDKWPARKLSLVAYNKPAGGVLGSPHLFCVLEDVRMLRMLENITLEMIDKNINPILHAKVGAGKDLAGGKEAIAAMKRELEYWNPHNGFLVTNQFTSLELKGAESQALRVEGLIKYFRQRVLDGLAISEMSLGNGGETTRATGEIIDKKQVDRVKAYRQALNRFCESVLLKLQLELGQDPFSNPDHICWLEFGDIDPDLTIKLDNHIKDMVNQGILGLNEGRARLSLEPVDDKTGWDDNVTARKAELDINKGADTQIRA